jgi:prevent-host-death family protein
MKKKQPNRVREPVGVADFKAHCLAYVDAVGTKGARYVITKHGKPVARVEPVGPPRPLKGLFRDQLTIAGDIVTVDWTDEWEAAR